MTTRRQADALRSKIHGLVTGRAEILQTIVDTTPLADLTDLLPEVMWPVIDQAAILTAEWYDSLVPNGRFRVRDEHDAVTDGRIAYTISWAAKASGQETFGDRIVGTFQRMVFDASRGVVVGNAKREGVPWHRDARSDACSFCRLLAVDPGAYHGKYVEMPSHNHDCRCIAVASRDGNPYVPPAYVEEWEREVRAQKSGDLTSTLAGMDA